MPHGDSRGVTSSTNTQASAVGATEIRPAAPAILYFRLSMVLNTGRILRSGGRRLRRSGTGVERHGSGFQAAITVAG